jgi:hypothetical protein
VRRLDAAFPQRKSAELVLRKLQPNFQSRFSNFGSLPEDVFDLVKDCGVAVGGLVVHPYCVAKLLHQFALLTGQFRGRQHQHVVVQIPFAAAPRIGQSLALDAKNRATLRAFRGIVQYKSAPRRSKNECSLTSSATYKSPDSKTPQNLKARKAIAEMNPSVLNSSTRCPGQLGRSEPHDYFRVADNPGVGPLMNTGAFHRTNVEFGKHWSLSVFA